MARPIHQPPKDVAARSIRRSTVASGNWWKVHPPSRNATGFTHNPGHRFSPRDAEFSVLYLAADVTTCLWEIFGDELFASPHILSLSAWTSRMVTTITVPETSVCNLTLASVRTSMGCDLSALLLPDLAIPQKWAGAIQEHPAGFSGIIYPSRFTGEHCAAFFFPPSEPESFRSESGIPLTEHPEALEFLSTNRIALV
jgi:hypothetical protein